MDIIFIWLVCRLWVRKKIIIIFIQVPVQEQLEFPCESSTLYGHFNPLGINSQFSPKLGTPDQFEAGDLSGKFGPWDNKTSVLASYNDSSLTLFGTQSILGRSVVINKRVKNSRYSIKVF